MDIRRGPALVAALLALLQCASAAASVRPVDPPPAGRMANVVWLAIDEPGIGTVQLAVVRPRGRGPFPTIVILHGTHGFARDYVDVAQSLARSGFVAIAPCWFAPGAGEGRRFITPLDCPENTPALSGHQSDTARQTIDSIMAQVRILPGVDPKRLALFGHSRGAGLAWDYILRGGKAQAVVLNSAGYTDELINRAERIPVPVLILHGRLDNPADGGSAMTAVARAKSFEAALRKAGKVVDAVYYPQSGHNGLFASRMQRRNELRRIATFLRRHLSRH